MIKAIETYDNLLCVSSVQCIMALPDETAQPVVVHYVWRVVKDEAGMSYSKVAEVRITNMLGVPISPCRCVILNSTGTMELMDLSAMVEEPLVTDAPDGKRVQ